MAGDLEIGEALHGELPNVFRRYLGARPQHNGRGNVFTQCSVRHGESYGFCDRRMFEQHLVDFAWGDFLTTAIDHLPAAANQKQIAVIIEKTKIAGLKPVAGKRSLVAAGSPS